MEGDVARLAQRNSVVHVEAQFWELSPSLNVMRVHAAPVIFAAVAACVFITPPYGLHPFEIFGRAALVLIGLAALPVPVLVASLRRALSAPLRCSLLNVLCGLRPTTQAWARNAGLLLGDSGKRFGRPAAHAPLVPINESARQSFDTAPLAIRFSGNGSELSASALAVHRSYFSAEAA
jgi:hypothetical protein